MHGEKRSNVQVLRTSPQTGRASSVREGALRSRAVKPKKFDAGDIVLAFAKVAAAVGTAQFYEVFIDELAPLFDCERRLVVRYARYSRPEFLINRSLSAQQTAFFEEKLYRLDPWLRMIESGNIATVVTFVNNRNTEPDCSFYDDLFASTTIFDELAVMLPVMSGVWIALCLDRNTSAFSEAEIMRMRQLYPLMEAFHRQHIERILIHPRFYASSGLDLAVMLHDRRTGTVFRSERWKAAVQVNREAEIIAIGASSRDGNRPFGDKLALHWEPLPSNHPIAPDGTIYMIEARGSGYIDKGLDEAFAMFSREYDLTPREIQIVELIMNGFQNAAIARKLGISVGTVKNHRYRLYTKLDVTTEREIFSRFITMLTT